MAGLEPCVFLAKGAQVMLTMNLWTDVGLCNGATGTAIDFIYADNHQPPDLPQAVIVKFDNYKGPSISKSIPSCVPIGLNVLMECMSDNNCLVRSVCFNPAKRPLLEKYQKGRTAVRLHKITSSIKDDIESIIIQNNTTVQPVVVPFLYKYAATSSSLPSLSSLQEVSKEQLVDVKAKVSSITAVKTINSRYGYALQRQEVILVDHTTSIKLILWQEHCNKLEDQKTYALQNLGLKESNGSRYLNTPKSEQFLFKEIPSFTQDLAQVTTEIESLTQRKVSGKIIGVQHASKSLSCTSCKKKVTVKSNGKIANCQSC
ncbi:unnamed protein product, partial [Pocillopora meandrina]